MKFFVDKNIPPDRLHDTWLLFLDKSGRLWRIDPFVEQKSDIKDYVSDIDNSKSEYFYVLCYCISDNETKCVYIKSTSNNDNKVILNCVGVEGEVIEIPADKQGNKIYRLKCVVWNRKV